jgi:hypothetical protein
MSACVEVRSYNLRPGTRAEFHRLVQEQAMPMLKRWQMEVVSYGPSEHDADSYYLIRAFGSLEAREREENDFYGSAEWRDGPRESILALIENYTTVVLLLDDATLEGLRRARRSA